MTLRWRLFPKYATPAYLPVERPTKFELMVNMKTAKAFGLAMPRSVLIRANRMIEWVP